MLIWDSFQLDKTMPDAETMGPEFYAPFVNTRYDYDASKICDAAAHSQCK